MRGEGPTTFQTPSSMRHYVNTKAKATGNAPHLASGCDTPKAEALASILSSSQASRVEVVFSRWGLRVAATGRLTRGKRP